MKKIALIAAAAGIVGFAGTASATHKDDYEPSGSAFGVYGCAEGEFKNPGELFRNVREATGQNPKEFAERGGRLRDQSVGETIEQVCGETGEPFFRVPE